MMGAAFRLAFGVRFETNLPVFQNFVVPDIDYYQRVTFFMAIVWWIIFALSGLYSKKYLLGGPEEYALVFRASTITLLLVIVAGFLQPEFIIARGWLLLAWSLSFLMISIGRFLLRRVVYYLREFGYYVSPALIIGANEEGIQLAKQLTNWRFSGLKIIGFVDKKFSVDTVPTGSLRVLGRVEQLDELIERYGVEELILASSSISSRDKLLDIFRRYGVAGGVNVRMSSGLYEIITTGISVKEFAYVPLVEVNKVRLTGIDNALKLILDYGIALPLLVLISPLLLALAVAIKLDSPGPIIHRRRVMGVNGTQFDAYKFRTMFVNGDEILAKSDELQKELADKHKLKVDPRITRVGRILRKFSLDELPQIFNVLKYQMSIVGPRMIHPDEMVEYDQWEINLLTVRPGITGLWQVSGRSDLTYSERVRLDMHYIRNWSIWLDLQIIYQTIPTVIRAKGAY
jgi:exopolysaccharide biosynthesis polyprenyl glycosylphosphotransferase